MSTSTVCVECFADEFLRDLVRAEGTPSGENCKFCGAEGQPCVTAEGLTERFEKVVLRLFKRDSFAQEQGRTQSLGHLLRESLGAFNPDMRDPDQLVRAILGRRWDQASNYPDLDDSWISVDEDAWADRGESYSFALTILESEVRKLGHSFYLGPGRPVTTQGRVADYSWQRLKQAIELTKLWLEPGTLLYRARLDLKPAVRNDAAQYEPPPVALANAARANAQSQPVWYLAREAKTAMAELRPGRASEVSVTAFAVRQRLKLCSLQPRVIETNPFDDVERYVKEKDVADVVAMIGGMFAKPIRPVDTGTEYLITQHLARMVRDDGYDGIAYPSSQFSNGLNYVLFHPMLPLEFGGQVRTYVCEGIEYSWKSADRPAIRTADDGEDRG